MFKKFRLAMLAATAALGVLALHAPAQAAGNVRVGVLTCNVSSGWGFIIGSSRSLNCTFSPHKGPPERFTGSVSKFGVDIGYQQSAVIVWGVLAAHPTVPKGSLAGTYGGVTGSAAVGVGAGANVLVGGFSNSITLQPVSVEGDVGLNVAAGIAAMTLTPSH